MLKVLWVLLVGRLVHVAVHEWIFSHFQAAPSWALVARRLKHHLKLLAILRIDDGRRPIDLYIFLDCPQKLTGWISLFKNFLNDVVHVSVRYLRQFLFCQLQSRDLRNAASSCRSLEFFCGAVEKTLLRLWLKRWAARELGFWNDRSYLVDFVDFRYLNEVYIFVVIADSSWLHCLINGHRTESFRKIWRESELRASIRWSCSTHNLWRQLVKGWHDRSNPKIGERIGLNKNRDVLFATGRFESLISIWDVRWPLRQG